MITFLKIITFPLRLAFLIIAFILRAVISALGLLITFISEDLGAICSLIGKLSDIVAVVMTIFSICQIKSGEMSLAVGLCCIGAFAITTLAVNGIWLIGDSIGEFLIDFERGITDFAIGLLTL